MSEKRYYQPEIETMPLDEMRKLQSEKLRKQVKHNNSSKMISIKPL